MKKRLLSFVLSAAMMLTYFSVLFPAYADEELNGIINLVITADKGEVTFRVNLVPEYKVNFDSDIYLMAVTQEYYEGNIEGAEAENFPSPDTPENNVVTQIWDHGEVPDGPEPYVSYTQTLDKDQRYVYFLWINDTGFDLNRGSVYVPFALDAEGNLAKTAMAGPTVSLAGAGNTTGGLTAAITPNADPDVVAMVDHYQVDLYYVTPGGYFQDLLATKDVDPAVLTADFPLDPANIPDYSGAAGKQYGVKVTAVAKAEAELGNSYSVESSPAVPDKQKLSQPTAALAQSGAGENSLTLEQVQPTGVSDSSLYETHVGYAQTGTVIDSFAKIGNDWKLTGLNADTTYDVQIKFVPTTAGAAYFMDSDASSTLTQATLEAASYAISVSPDSGTIGGQAYGYSASDVSAGTSTTVTNNSNRKIKLTASSNSAGFRASVSSAQAIEPGATATVTVVPATGLGAATHEGTITVQATQEDGTVLTGTAADFAVRFTVSKATLSWRDNGTVAVADRAYDGTDKAAVTGSPTLDGVVNGDTLSVAPKAGAEGTFDAGADVGADKTVTIGADQFEITGANAANYNLPTADITTTATITQKVLGLKNNNVVIGGKVYDGTTAAAVESGSIDLEGVLNGEDVSLDASKITYAFQDKNAGPDKAVTATVGDGALSGGDAGNYKLPDTKTLSVGTAAVSAKPISITVGAVNKEYGKTFTASNVDFTVDNESTALVSGDTKAGLGVTLASVGFGPAAGVGAYEVTGTYTTSNYEITVNGTNALTVIQAVPVLRGSVSATGVKVGQTVGDSVLSGVYENPYTHDEVTGEFAWDTPEEQLDTPGTTGAKDWTFKPDSTNYENVTGSNTIQVADKAEPTVTASPQTVTYNGQEQAFTNYTVTPASVSVKVEYEIGGTWGTQVPKNAGVYAVRITTVEDGDYKSVSETATLSINQLEAVINGSGVSVKEKTYDGTLAAEYDSGAFTITNQVAQDRVGIDINKVSFAFEDGNVSAGGVAVTATLADDALNGEEAGNYKLPGVKTVAAAKGMINAKPVTLNAIAKSKEYGQTGSVSSSDAAVDDATPLVAPDTINELGLVLESGAAAADAAVGSYAITLASAANTNYAVTLGANQAYTVTQAEPELVGDVSATDIKVGQKVSDCVVTGTVQNPNNSAAVDGMFSWKNGEAIANTAGTIEGQWLFTPENEANYKPLEGTVTIRVNNKEVPELSATDKTETYTAEAVVFDTYTTNSDGGVTVSYKVKDSGDETYTGQAPVDAGSYTVRINTGETDTYQAKSVTAALTITKAALGWSNGDVAVAAKTYDGTTEAAFTGKPALTGVKGGDGANLSVAANGGALGAFDNKNAGTGRTVTIAADQFTISGTALKNYTPPTQGLSITGLEISARAVSVGVNEVSKEYGETKTLSNDDFELAAGSSLASGETKADLELTLSSDGLAAGADVGQYDVTGTGANTNYEVTVNGTKKLTVTPFTPVAEGQVTAGGVYVGQTVGDATLRGVFKNKGGEVVEGSLTWDAPQSVLNEAGQSEQGWTFQPVSGNYAAVHGTAEIQVSAKTVPELSAADKTVSYTAEEIVFDAYTTNSNGAVSVEYKQGEAADSEYTAQAPVNAGRYMVRVSTAATLEYEAKTVTAALTIEKAKPAGSVSVNGITEEQHLSDAVLVAGYTDVKGNTLAGSIAWDNPNVGGKAPEEIIPEADTEYSWTFTPEDSTNYEAVRGTSKVTVGESVRQATVLGIYNLPNEEGKKDYAYIALDENLRVGDVVTFYSDAQAKEAISSPVTVTELTENGKLKAELKENALKKEGGKVYAKIEGSASVTEAAYGAELDFSLSPSSVSVVVNKTQDVTVGISDESYQLKEGTDVAWTVEDEQIASLSDTSNSGAKIKGLKSGKSTTVTVKAVFRHPDAEVTEEIVVTKTLKVSVRTSGGGGGGGGSVTRNYTVTYVAGANGTLEGAEKETVSSGNVPKQAPEVKAVEGFEFSGWSLSEGGEVIDLSKQKIYENTTLYAVYKQSQAEQSQYHQAYMQGYKDGSFRPDGKITRGEAATIFARLYEEGFDENESYESNFTDVKEEDWYVNYVGFAQKKGLLKGYEDGSFRPEASITRGEFAAIVARYEELEGKGESKFKDVAGHWAKEEIAAVEEKGWIGGYPDGSYRPEEKISRAETVRIVNGMLGRGVEEVGLREGEYKEFGDVKKEHWAYYEVIEASNSHRYVREEESGKEEWE